MKINYKYSASLLALAGVLSAFTVSQANAAGFYLQEQSVSGLGSAFAGQAAMPRDASTIYFNPAGLTYLEGGNLNLGANILMPKSKSKDTGSALGGGSGGNPYDTEIIPNLSISQQLNDKVWLGVGFAAPFGLGSEYNDGWYGRFDATETELKTYNVTPVAAFKINDRLSFGAGLDIQYAEAEIKNLVHVGGGNGAPLTLKGDDTSVSWHAGLMYQATEQLRLGLHYRAEMNHTLQGSAEITGLQPALPGTVDLGLPSMWSLGVAYDVTPETTLLFGATRFGWSSYDSITVEYSGIPGTPIDVAQNYKDTWAFNIGVEHDFNDTWTGRAGVQYDQTPTRDNFRSHTTPDGDRIWVSAGATYNINDKWSMDFAATYIDVSDEKINLTRPNGATIQADTSGHVGIVGLALNYKF